jgi:TonB-dependent heme/hemoglobin receptor
MKTLLSIICTLLVITSVFAENKKDDDNIKKHINLKEVVVNASRLGLKLKNIPGKVEIIPQRIIENTSANDLGDLLKKTTGIDIVEYPGMLSGISLRGFSPKTGENNYTVILIDGVPAGTTNIATISLNNIESIEILKGPYSSLYGSQAMGGIINIVTKRNTGDLQTNLSVTYGSFDKQSLNINMGGNLTKKLSFRLSAQREKQNSNYEIGNKTFFSLSKEDKTKLGFDKDDINITNSTYSKDNFDAKLNYNISDAITTSLSYSYFEGNDVKNPGSVLADHPYLTIKDLNRHNTSFNITAKKGNHELSATTYYSIDKSKDYNSIQQDKFINLEKDYKVFGFQLNDVISFNNHKLTFGLDYKKDDYTSDRWDDNKEITSPYNPDYFNSKFAGYIQTNLNFLDNKLSVSGGLRGDIIKLNISENELLTSKKQTEKYNEINYNIGAKYEITNELSAYSSWGTAFLSPTALQKAGGYELSLPYYNERFKGNADLDPETSKTIELGISYNKNNFSADISWFSTNYTNKITADYSKSDATGPYTTYKNSEKATMKGLEAELSYNFTELFDNSISIEPYIKWSWLYEASEKNGDIESSLLYVKRHNGILGVRISDMNKFDSNISFKYAGERKEKEFGIGVIEMPAYVTIDLSASYRINKMFKVAVFANNLLDERYCEKYGYILPGRNFMAKLNINF